MRRLSHHTYRDCKTHHSYRDCQTHHDWRLSDVRRLSHHSYRDCKTHHNYRDCQTHHNYRDCRTWGGWVTIVMQDSPVIQTIRLTIITEIVGLEKVDSLTDHSYTDCQTHHSYRDCRTWGGWLFWTCRWCQAGRFAHGRSTTECGGLCRGRSLAPARIRTFLWNRTEQNRTCIYRWRFI